MTKSYHDFKQLSPYLSSDPLDAGIRVRLSGELLIIYNTARAHDSFHRARKSRGSISKFSTGSSTRMGRYLRESVAEYNFMHTLTYPSEYPSDGKLVKYQLRRYIQELSRLGKKNQFDKQFSVFWFIEFQQRGAPHFHLFTTHFYPFKKCAELWHLIVGSGLESHLKAGTRVEKIKTGRHGCISYAKKYARKQEQKIIPVNYQNVGRFWGVCGLKTRQVADAVFFVDKCKKSHISNIKSRLFTLIRHLCDIKALKSLKSHYGFRLFRIDISSKFYLCLWKSIFDAGISTKTEEELDYDAQFVAGNRFVYVDKWTGCNLKDNEVYGYYKKGEAFQFLRA